MRHTLPPLRLTHAKVLEDGRLEDVALAFEEGVICEGPTHEVNLSGYWLLPGIIDLHGDGFEHHLAPRPTAPFDKVGGLASADRELAANGVTTAYFAQSWSWEGGIRSEDYAEDLMDALHRYRPEALSDIRLQIRYEIYQTHTAERMLNAMARYGVDYVVFNDHLTESLDAAKNNPKEIAAWAAKHGRTTQEHLDILDTALTFADQVPETLSRLSEAFKESGVRFGSHDDGTAALREHYHALGATICEFPTGLEAAKAAQRLGDPVLMGAPNVVRGGSQSGNIDARTLLEEGLCHGLVSDYYYPALAAAAWRLVDDGVMGFEDAWHLISTGPADVFGLSDWGRLRAGQRADLVVMNPQTRRIEATICAGHLAYLAGEAGRRFLGRGAEVKLAAE
ncbi:MAG: alpha-D-ribose 1-methylphosphonate 5-triphosphate diphosphatase [Pseudomonadota bacterium]